MATRRTALKPPPQGSPPSLPPQLYVPRFQKTPRLELTKFQLTSHVTVAQNVTTPQTSAVEAKTTSAPFAFANGTTSAIAAGITASSTTLASVSGTGAGGARQTFTGAASTVQLSRAQAVVSGFAAVMALLFL